MKESLPMDYTNTTVGKLNHYKAVFEVMLQSFYLIESATDALHNREHDKHLISHISFLIEEYKDRMAELVPMLDNTFKEAFNSANNDALLIDKHRLNEVYKTDTVG